MTMPTEIATTVVALLVLAPPAAAIAGLAWRIFRWTAGI